jgi:UDPglucose 6-dehydrogenase
MRTPVIGYAGMTHLGLLSAVAAAAQGFETICFDPDTARAAALTRGELPVVEPDLPAMLAANQERLRFTSDPSDLGGCDLVYVAPDVPTDDQGGSDLVPIETLLERVVPVVRDTTVLVILSQVPPGFTRRHPRPRGAPLHYQVETLVFGRAVERALKPERFIVGCHEPRLPLPAALTTFLGSFGCPILPMRLESAELAKIAINVCLVASVSVANTLAELCEGIGADWGEIAPALRLDRRIGLAAYLAPGLGIAGGNLERDLATVIGLSEATGSDVGIIRAFIANSRHRRDWVLRTLHEHVLAHRRHPVLAILGLAYKENTASVKNSPSLALLAALPDDVALRVHDPVVPAAMAKHPSTVGAETALDACVGADAVVVMTPWPVFRTLDPTDIAVRLAGRTVIDPYGIIDPVAAEQAGLRHFRLGAPTPTTFKA